MQYQSLVKLDMALLVLFPILSCIISLLIDANYFVSNLLFFGLPALWMSYRTQHRVLRTLIFTGIVTIPFTIVIDYIAIYNNMWYVPHTIFPFRVLGIIPLEDFLQVFLTVYGTIILYEHFLHKGKHHLIDHRMKYLVWPMISVLLIFLVVLVRKPEILRIQYAYLWLGSIFLLIPALCYVAKFPKLLSKYSKVAAYYFFLTVSFEFTALHLGQWTFPSTEFIGWIQIFHIRFPFEEFFFWFCMLALAIISYYEFFDDDPVYEQS
jgi:hypothetical protein